jgi:hypothetical protein
MQNSDTSTAAISEWALASNEDIVYNIETKIVCIFSVLEKRAAL